MNFGQFFIAFLLTLPFAVGLALWKRKQGPSKWQRMEVSAKTAGRVVKAYRGKVKYCHGDMDAPSGSMLREDTYRTKYEYEVNGRKYKYRAETIEYPPEQTELWYPAGKPAKAKPFGYNPPTGKDAILAFLPIIVMAIIYWTLPLVATLLYGLFQGG